MGAALKFPHRGQPEPKPVLYALSRDEAGRLLDSAKTALDSSDRFVAEIDADRSRARDFGYESAAIELGALVESQRFIGILDELERAVQEGTPANLTALGLDSVHRASKLVSEIQMLKSRIQAPTGLKLASPEPIQKDSETNDVLIFGAIVLVAIAIGAALS